MSLRQHLPRRFIIVEICLQADADLGLCANLCCLEDAAVLVSNVMFTTATGQGSKTLIKRDAIDLVVTQNLLRRSPVREQSYMLTR